MKKWSKQKGRVGGFSWPEHSDERAFRIVITYESVASLWLG